ncbi:uncharacterized protein LOC144120695 [Amblyomma americanum]
MVSPRQLPSMWRASLRLRSPFSATTLGSFFVCLYYLWKPWTKERLFTQDRSAIGDWQRVRPVGHRILTPGCTIPEFDPFDPTARSYFRKKSGPRCHGKPNFITVRNGFPAILPERLKEHDVVPEDLVCFYKEIYRNESLDFPDEKYMFGPRAPLLFGKLLTKEFLFVECATRQYPEHPFHDQFVLNPIVKESVEERRHGAPIGTPHNLNVLLLGLDSVSYLNFERQLPKTAHFVREKLGAFELYGYNKVGDNSYPNQVPLIAGIKATEADRAAPDGIFDNMTARLIWNMYSERGYRSMFLEECTFYGIFNYLAHGFRRAPADYYPRPVIMAMDDSPKKTQHWRYFRCLGPTMGFEELLDYFARFTEVMAETPFFAYVFLIEITHDELNSAGYADEPFRRLLDTLYASGVLNQTVLVFLSDHGLRFGDMRATYIGTFEDREPFAFLAFPPWFLKKNPEAARSLRINQRRLTTPFDVHATLVELLGYPDLKQLNTTYGLSLLHEVPNTRTCADASISRHWCTCNAHVNAHVSSALAWSLCSHFVSAINSWVVLAARKCATYRLVRIIHVIPLQASPTERASNISHYLLAVELSPGGAKFEATLRVNSNTVTVLNEISRLDAYSRMSDCVKKQWLEKFCYCIRTIDQSF